MDLRATGAGAEDPSMGALGEAAMLIFFGMMLCLPTAQPVISWNDSKS
jgi:hypothetical protein